MKCLSLKKYLDETSLHGFGYANDKSKFFTIFWAILTVSCGYYTVHDIVALVQTYLLVPTVVSISVVPNLDAVLPTPTLCMEMIVATADSNLTTDDIKADIAAFMFATNNGVNLNVSRSQMNLTNRLEYLTYLMLGHITDFEMRYTGYQNPTYTDYVNKYVEHNDIINVYNRPSALKFQSFLQPVYNAYLSYRVSLANLKRLVAISICSKQIGFARYGSLLGGNPGLPISSICQADSITHLSFSLLCVKLFNTSTFTITQGLTVSIGGFNSASQQPFPAITRTLKCQDTQNMDLMKANAFPVQFFWYVDIQGRSVIPNPPFRDIITVDPAFTVSKFDVTLSAEYNFYNVPTISNRTCSTAIRQHDCIRQKKAELISQSCNCWPSILLGVDNINKMPTCSDNFAKPNNDVLGNLTYLQRAPVSDVTSLCNPDCNANLYSSGGVDAAVTVDRSTLSMPNYAAGVGSKVALTGSMEITFQSSTLRSLIVESPSMPFTTFACGLGGIIGTYMGGSILAFVHIPIFILAQLTDLVTKRKKVENSEKADANINNLPKEEIYPPVIEAKVV